MSRSIARWLIHIAVAGSLVACGQSSAPPAVTPSAPPAALQVPTIFEAMAQTFMPQANKLWEMAGNLYADNGELDPKQLTDQQWQDVSAAAKQVQDLAIAFSETSALHVAPAGAKLQNDGVPGARTAAEIQAAIDANPQGFKDESKKLAAVAADFGAAAAAHDAVKADDASNRLTEVCTACHNTYWYPEEAAQP